MAENRGGSDGQDQIDRLVEAIIVDTHGDGEQWMAFHQAIQDALPLPCDAFVIGEPVSLVAVDYDGNIRRGLTARVLRADGTGHVVAAEDVSLGRGSSGSEYLAAYRRWLGLAAPGSDDTTPLRRKRRHKVAETDLKLSESTELVVLSVRPRAARCRLLGTDRLITLRAGGSGEVIPGEIAVVSPRKVWSYAGHPYLSADIVSTRLDVPALGLVPLALHGHGIWSPEDVFGGEELDQIGYWAKPIVARGPRQAFEMEQSIPGRNPEEDESDPIYESVELTSSGRHDEARRLLMELCEADLRCLDAHAHLGNLEFDRPDVAIRHYEVGVRIGELSLGGSFDGLLPWGCVDNRPFLRCVDGLALSLWRLRRFEEAERAMERLMWLNPSDDQGVRLVIQDVRARAEWRDPDVGERAAPPGA